MRRRTVVLTGAGVLLAVVVGVTVWWVSSGRPAPQSVDPVPPPVTALPLPDVAAPASSPVGDGPATVADGCLAGGFDPLAAQAQATLDPAGAAGFVLTLARWAGQYPMPQDADAVLAQTVGPEPLRDTFHATMVQFAAAHATDGRPVNLLPGGAVQWRVTAADDHTVTLDWTAYWHPVNATGDDGKAHSFSTVTLDQSSGHWVVTARSDTVPADPYASLPAAPWQAYAGVC